MNSGQAKRIIVVSIFVAATLASVKSISDGKVPDVKIAVGAVVLAIFLLTLAEVSPRYAGAFGLLVLASAMFAQGPDVYKTLAKAGGH